MSRPSCTEPSIAKAVQPIRSASTKEGLPLPSQAPYSDINVCELRIEGIESTRKLAAARWELFVFEKIRYIHRVGTTNRVAILYHGAQPNVDAWVTALAAAGFRADPFDAIA